MTWNSVTDRDLEIARAVVLWIETARASGYASSTWLPSEADIQKSALFERIRSGKEPLEFPPPRGMSCPWYALVEDKGPHFVGREGIFGPYFGSEGDLIGTGLVSILQNTYEIIARNKDIMILKDRGHDTPYRFRLWFDKDWLMPNSKNTTPGGWFLQNMEFDKSV